jgi:lipase chaperone LimK
LKYVRDTLLGQVAKNPFNAESSLAKIKQGMDNLLAKVPASQRESIIKEVRQQADTLCTQLQKDIEKSPKGSSARE